MMHYGALLVHSDGALRTDMAANVKTCFLSKYIYVKTCKFLLRICVKSGILYSEMEVGIDGTICN